MLNKNVAEQPDDIGHHKRLAVLAGWLNATATILLSLGLAWVLWRYGIALELGIVLMAALIAAVALDQLWLFGRGIVFGLRQEAKANLPAAAGTVIASILGVAFVYYGLGVAGVFLGLALGRLLAASFTLAFALRHLCRPAPMRAMTQLPIRALVKFCASTMLFSVMAMALYRSDIILIRYLSNDTQAGLYAAAVQWSEFVWFAPLAVQGVMLQSTARLWREHRQAELTALLARLLRYVALITLYLLVVVCVCASQLMALYFGSDYSAAASAMRLLAPGVFSFALARVLWPVTQAQDRALSSVIIISLATLTNLGLNWLLIPDWGAAGAAMATCVSYGGVVFGYVRILHSGGVHPFRGFMGGRLLLLGGITGGLASWASTVSSANLPSVLLAGSVATAVFGLGAIWLGLLRVSELQQIIDSLPRFLRRPSERLLARIKPVFLCIGE